MRLPCGVAPRGQWLIAGRADCSIAGLDIVDAWAQKTMADRKNKLGLSVAIGAGVGAALGVALHHLPLWLSLGCVGGIVTGIILTRMTRSSNDKLTTRLRSSDRESA